MLTFDLDARQARISRTGEAPIDGQLVCYYPCPRCSSPGRALVYLADAALAQEVVARVEGAARHPGLLAVGIGLALNGGHGQWGGRGHTDADADVAEQAPREYSRTSRRAVDNSQDGW